MGTHLQQAIEKDKDWYRKNIYTTKFFVLNLLTLGQYGIIKMTEKLRLSGLL